MRQPPPGDRDGSSEPDKRRSGRVDLSIVIVNHQTLDDLNECLETLRYLTASESPATEIIVVDNSSRNQQTAAVLASHPHVTYLENQGNYGFAHACNRGAHHASGRELLFLNPDVRDGGDAVRRFFDRKIHSPRFAIMTVRQNDRDGRPQRVFGRFPSITTLLGPVRYLMQRLHSERHPDPKRSRARELEIDWVSGSALMITRGVFEELDGWCADFWMYSEDVDLCRRARDEGYRAGYVGDIELEHRHGSASRRDVPTSALTRSEVIISRHLYARRHLSPTHQLLYHVLLILSRFVPLLIPALLHRMLPTVPAAIRVRALMFRHLAAHYHRIVLGQSWLSPRSANFDRRWTRYSGESPDEPSVDGTSEAIRH